MTALLSNDDYWYLMRGSGFVALGLLTGSTCLGIANLVRIGRKTSTRTVAALIHRNTSLLAIVFLVIHVVTAVADRYAGVSLTSVFVPGTSNYDPVWVGLGAVSLDLMAAIAVTSVLRTRLRPKVWRFVHWTAYASWPTAFFHAIGSGSGAGVDTGRSWSTLVYLATGLAFAIAVAARLRLGRKPRVTPLPATALRRQTTAIRS